jgi:hypothetical protein
VRNLPNTLIPESVMAKIIYLMHPDLIDAGKTIKMDFQRVARMPTIVTKYVNSMKIIKIESMI